MEVGGKILTGAVATALLALVGHYVTGDGFVSGLEKSAQTEMTAKGIDGVTVAFDRDPLSRTAVLDGDVSEEAKQKALGAVLAIPGVSSARWKGEADIEAANGDGETDPATAAKITQCQDGVDKAIEGKKLNFKSGSAYISPASNKLLDEVAASLKPCSDLTVAVGGHTDSTGDAAVNKDISQERAARVRQGLIDRGIAENRVTATGYGSEKPLTQDTGGDANAQNRRIEFKIAAGTDANADSPQGE
jgi:OOP family OmpA-OmpF porin